MRPREVIILIMARLRTASLANGANMGERFRDLGGAERRGDEAGVCIDVLFALFPTIREN
jgi:hypothetical protein